MKRGSEVIGVAGERRFIFILLDGINGLIVMKGFLRGIIGNIFDEYFEVHETGK